MQLLMSLRQMTFPREFRIHDGAWNEKHQSQLDQLIEVLRTQTRTDEAAADGKSDNESLRRLMADVGTGLWRMRHKMINPESGEAREEMSQVYRHLRSVWDALAAEGIEIIDNTGEPYDSGRALSVVAFQPTAGLGREIIIETIRPTIYWGDAWIQSAEVIVGTPETSTGE